MTVGPTNRIDRLLEFESKQDAQSPDSGAARFHVNISDACMYTDGCARQAHSDVQLSQQVCSACERERQLAAADGRM